MAGQQVSAREPTESIMDLFNKGKTILSTKFWLIIALTVCAAIIAFVYFLAGKYDEPIGQPSVSQSNSRTILTLCFRVLKKKIVASLFTLRGTLAVGVAYLRKRFIQSRR